MTVRDWLHRRDPQPPSALLARVLGALGVGADADVSELADHCLAAAKRTLDAMLVERRFGRESAIDLLAVDALMTYAYEYAATTSSGDRLASLADEGARRLGTLPDHHV